MLSVEEPQKALFLFLSCPRTAFSRCHCELISKNPALNLLEIHRFRLTEVSYIETSLPPLCSANSSPSSSYSMPPAEKGLKSRSNWFGHYFNAATSLCSLCFLLPPALSFCLTSLWGSSGNRYEHAQMWRREKQPRGTSQTNQLHSNAFAILCVSHHQSNQIGGEDLLEWAIYNKTNEPWGQSWQRWSY